VIYSKVWQQKEQQFGKRKIMLIEKANYERSLSGLPQAILTTIF